MAKTFSDWGAPVNGNFGQYFDYFTQQSFGEDFNEAAIKAQLQKDNPYFADMFDQYAQEARSGKQKQGKYEYTLGWQGYDPNDLSEAGLKRIESSYGEAINSAYGGTGFLGAAEFARLATIGLDLYRARTQFQNAQMQGVLSGIETNKLRRRQFEQMRKIATEGNEVASEDQKPTGKASVLIGSNVPDRSQRRASTSRDAGTARAKVKVQAKGINI